MQGKSYIQFSFVTVCAMISCCPQADQIFSEVAAPLEGFIRPMYNILNPYPTAFLYGNGMLLHFYQQQESSTTKTVHKVINKGLKTYV